VHKQTKGGHSFLKAAIIFAAKGGDVQVWGKLEKNRGS
jgi:hypothetical protein